MRTSSGRLDRVCTLRRTKIHRPSGVPRNFVRGGGGFNKFSWGRRTERTGISGGGSPLIRGSGGSCNLVQEISFHIVFFFYIFGTLFMMTTNLFVIANVKQLPFSEYIWGGGVLNSAIFNCFHKSGWVWHNFRGPSEFRGVGLNTPNPPPPRYATVHDYLYRCTVHFVNSIN